jgi:pimeloyl-ACP methyl ester carboxylesterase
MKIASTVNERSLKKVSDIYFYQYGTVNTARPIVVIPGGPWISGEYMDELTNELHLNNGLTAYRMILPNHEIDINLRNKNINFEDFLSKTRQSIQEIMSLHTQMPILIGHSFGSVLLAHLLLDSTFRYAKVILVSSVLSLSFSPEFSSLLRKAGIITPSHFQSEDLFLHWWRNVLPYYFAKSTHIHISLKKLSKQTFMSENLNQAEGVSDLPSIYLRVSEKCKKNEVDLYFFEGDQDPLGLTDNLDKLKDIFGQKVQTISGSGHFPMLENKAAFMQAIGRVFTLAR